MQNYLCWVYQYLHYYYYYVYYWFYPLPQDNNKLNNVLKKKYNDL